MVLPLNWWHPCDHVRATGGSERWLTSAAALRCSQDTVVWMLLAVVVNAVPMFRQLKFDDSKATVGFQLKGRDRG